MTAPSSSPASSSSTLASSTTAESMGNNSNSQSQSSSNLAAIKMDELLVHWLASDDVYKNVLEWIETCRTQEQLSTTKNSVLEEIKEKAQANKSANSDSDNNENEKEGGDNDGNSTAAVEVNDKTTTQQKVVDGSDDDSDNDEEETKSEKTSSVIPTFYPRDKASQRRTNNDNDDGNNTAAAPPLLLWNDEEASTNAKLIFEELGSGSNNNNTDDDDSPEQQQPTTLSLENFVRITKEVCQFPSYFNVCLYSRILDVYNTNNSGRQRQNDEVEATEITFSIFEYYWMMEMEPYDISDRLFRLICSSSSSSSRQHDINDINDDNDNDVAIVRDDFLPFIQALLQDHPGLEFLSSHQEFQEKYAITVITRIFYHVDIMHSGKITRRQLRQSDLYDIFQQVDEEEDINKVTKYFSYEHFYVLYCRFWELDHDRDYKITREDLLKYGDHSLSHMIVDRIFDAAPRPFGTSNTTNTTITTNTTANTTTPENDDNNEGGDEKPASSTLLSSNSKEYLSYEDFIYFMLSEEDKTNEVSVKYWFTCVDVDGDGKLNNMEMRSFYAVQLHRMQVMGHEIVPFEDMLCQMMDMIKPQNPDYLVVEDFLQEECSQVSGALFDALFNLNKYLLFEQRDPFAERQRREDEFQNDWDRFACIDYNRLAMEEEAREEEAMEIDWVTVDENGNNNNNNQDQQQEPQDNLLLDEPTNQQQAAAQGTSEAPF